MSAPSPGTAAEGDCEMDDREEEDRSWRPSAETPRATEPSPEMVEAGVKEIRRRGHLFLPVGVPRRWLLVMARETWKAMERVARIGH